MLTLSSTSPYSSTAIQTPANILIVDDDRQNRRLLEVLLGPEGYVMRTACGGEQALASITEGLPDLILLDYLMPGIDGLRVSRAVKASVAIRKIPIIMLTALDHSEALRAALDAGVEEFLTGPSIGLNCGCAFGTSCD